MQLDLMNWQHLLILDYTILVLKILGEFLKMIGFLNDYGVWKKKRPFDGEGGLLGVEKWEQKILGICQWGFVKYW